MANLYLLGDTKKNKQPKRDFAKQFKKEITLDKEFIKRPYEQPLRLALPGPFAMFPRALLAPSKIFGKPGQTVREEIRGLKGLPSQFITETTKF